MRLLLGEPLRAATEQVHDLGGLERPDAGDLGVESLGAARGDCRTHAVADMRAHAADDAVDAAAHMGLCGAGDPGDREGVTAEVRLLVLYGVLHPSHEAPP